MNRRKFFETSGRWLSTILLSTLGGYLILKREISQSATCNEQPICKQCLKFKGCKKPKAIAYQNPIP